MSADGEGQRRRRMIRSTAGRIAMHGILQFSGRWIRRCRVWRALISFSLHHRPRSRTSDQLTEHHTDELLGCSQWRREQTQVDVHVPKKESEKLEQERCTVRRL